MKKEPGNILFTGVGGQGILLASEVTSHALLEAGFDVKKSEVHGMAQRGGSVEAHVRYGEKVYAPLIEPGGADILVAFELMESVRYLTYLNRESRVVVNTQRILPPSVSAGAEPYPADALDELRARGLRVFAVDALEVARAVGEPRAVNMALVGALSGLVPVSEETFVNVMSRRIKKRFVDANVEAFRKGRELTAA